MGIDWFFCITLSIWVLRAYFKRKGPRKAKSKPINVNLERLKREDQRAKLKAQGYDDDLIAIILPTINNGS